MVPRIGKSVPVLSIITNHMINFIYENWGHLLTSFQQPWLSQANLQIFVDVISQGGAALDNCWGLVDGTVRPVSCPGQHQRMLYNGHKRLHAINFQSVVSPNGLIAGGMLTHSHLLNNLQQHCNRPNGDPFCIYGDPTYPLRPYFQRPFAGGALTQQHNLWNKSMSQVRIFKDIVNDLKFLDFKKNLKVGLSVVGKMYVVCALLHNTCSCLFDMQTSEYFNLLPPVLEDYFI